MISLTLLLALSPVYAAVDSLVLVSNDDGLFGYESADGELVVDYIYLSASEFDQGLALVSRDTDGSGWPYECGFIDATGEEVIPLIYESAEPFSEGFSVVRSGGLFGYITMEGDVALPFVYESAKSFSGGQAVVKENGVMQIISRPNLEAPNLYLEESTYVTFTSVDQYISYLSDAFGALEGDPVNEEAMVKLEQLLPHLMRQMPAVEVELDGVTVYVHDVNYSSVLTTSIDTYEQLMNLFDAYDMKPSNTLYYFLAMLRNGVGNPVQNGSSVTLRTGIDYIVMPFPHPYFDPTVYRLFVETSEYTAYLTDRLTSLGSTQPNEAGVLAIQDYISYSFLNFKPSYLKTKDNEITINAEEHSDYFKERSLFTAEINAMLEQYQISLLQDYNNEILILASRVDLAEMITVSLESSFIIPYLSNIDGIRIVVGTKGEGVFLPSDALQAILNGTSNYTFDIKFGGTHVELAAPGVGLASPIFFSLPSTSRTATIYASIGGNPAENWGGLYKLNNTIEFATSNSGIYSVQEAKLPIDDIEHLSREEQDTIHFMVSKGFFELDEMSFHPEEHMKRIEFISALVKMFYAQDSTATSNFVDVPESSPYYALVSAASQAGIASGYDGNIFGADYYASRTEVVSFMARTLASQKGYVFPENVDEVLSVFRDSDDIESWARENIALAVEHFLISTVGDFNGSDEISRNEGAKLLQTLFSNLYDTPEGGTIYGSLEEEKSSFLIDNAPYIAAGVGGLILVIALVRFIIRKLKQ